MSWDEAVEKCKDKTILVPHGSTEEHGYHLPLKIDSLVAERVCEIFYDSENVVVAPVMNYTGLKATKQIPGTIGPNPQEYETWLRTIISDFMKLKPKRIFFFLAHDGGTQQKVFDKLKKEFGEDKLNYLGAKSLDRQIREKGVTGSGGHAGEGETSLMLYIDPTNVKMERAVDEKWPDNFYEAGITKSGVNGKPSKATVEKGKKILEFYQQKLKESLQG